MNNLNLIIDSVSKTLSLNFFGEFTLYSVSSYEKKIQNAGCDKYKNIEINLNNITYLDTAAAIYINNFLDNLKKININYTINCKKSELLDTLELVKKYHVDVKEIKKPKKTFLNKIGKYSYDRYKDFITFLTFLGKLFATKFFVIKNIQHLRIKEIFYEMNESAINALGIIALTSFLIGLVVAYQSAYQLKIYGANIFIVDMLGISILRELAPVITAIVIAGRSGSAFTAQIGAMKITEELDAMRTMGFDPYLFLVIPRILALMITMPILIFVADIMGIFGGMIVANIDLDITYDMFLSRFIEVIDIKHFYVGIVKGPFFAFLIASIGIYRGLVVKDDTQSIGFNTTKSVVEAIFAVIICDALFSIAFTNLGI